MKSKIIRNPEKKYFTEKEEQDKTRIAVIGSQGCGISFICGLAAISAPKNISVCLAELGKPYYYNALDFGRRFALRGYKSPISALKDKTSVNDIRNTENGVNWLAKAPGDAELTNAELFRFLSRAPGDAVIFDCSDLDTETMTDIAAECSRVMIVIDPLPTELIKNISLIERLRLSFPEAIVVINKMNRGVHKAELERFIKTKNYIEIPYIDPIIIYSCEYRCMLPFENEEIKKLLGKASEELKSRLFY